MAVLVFLVGKIIHKLISIIALGFLNRLAGAIFGFLKTALVLSVILYFLNGYDTNSSIIKDEIKDDSYLYDPVEAIVPTILPLINLEKLSIPDKDDIGLPEIV